MGSAGEHAQASHVTIFFCVCLRKFPEILRFLSEKAPNLVNCKLQSTVEPFSISSDSQKRLFEFGLLESCKLQRKIDTRNDT